MTQPADLNISGKQDPSNKDYFDITINPLKLVTEYGFQFQWIFEDKELNTKVGDNWSPTYKVTTIADSINKPQFRSIDLDYTGNTLIVSWTGKDYLGADYKNNLRRVDIWVKGGSFGSEYKVADNFAKAGTKTITAAAGQYYVKLQAVSNSGGVSLFSDEQTIITESPLIVDLTPPANPTAPGVVAGVDPKDQTGFSAYATFSWTHHPDAATNGTRGYRVRWTYDTVNPIYEYGFVDYPNNSYTATGLIPNVEYTFQVASVDQFNNTQTYLTGGTFTATDPTISDGWARLKSYISIGGATGDLFKFGTGISTSINTSLTTTPSLTSGNYNGIILNKTGNNNNYWLTTGQFRVGGNTQFMYWDGTNLSVTGDLGVGGGATIAGNLFMKTTGASIYSGTIVNNELPEGTRGFVLNNNGLLVQDNGTGANRKYVRLDPTTGTIFANNAQITGNVVITGGATKTLIDQASTDASDAKTTVATKNKTFTQDDQPTNPINGYSLVAGDIWFDSNDGYRQHRWSGSAWVDVRDTGISAAQAKANSSLQAGGNAIINPSTNQITTIDITGIKISSGGVDLNGKGTATTAVAGSLVLNSFGITAKDGSGNNTFFINATTGDAEFKGSIKSGSTITGADFLLNPGTNLGGIKINGSNNQIEFLSSFGDVSGRIFVFADNEVIVASGSGSAWGSYPASAGMLSLYDEGVALQVTNSSGVSIGGISIDSTTAYFTGVDVQTTKGAPIGSVAGYGNYYMRNIGMGTGPKSTGDVDGYRGDIWIQYS